MQINDKNTLRRQLKNFRRNISINEKSVMDKFIAENFLNSNDYRNCKRLLIYVSSGFEVSTAEIMKKAFFEKEVYCPRCEGKGNQMDFYKVEDFSQLEKQSFGIFEPISTCKKLEDFSSDDICITPGLSFDKSGYRLGFGRGFYDRFFEKFNGIKIGICYESGYVEKLPYDDYDKKVDKLITEKNIYDFKNKKGR